jgi:hypothetical protein
MQSIMKFELLPNEILIECFEFLDAFDIFNSFNQLNYRFNNLIRNIPLHVNFENVNKSIFDQFCTTMLLNSEMKSQIYSLHLSDKYNCLQTKIFLSFFSFDEFSHLGKLETAFPLIIPPRFTRISNPESYFEIKLVDLPLSQLQTLSISTIDSSVKDIHDTSSIINLTITECSLTNLYELLKHIPMLKYLNIHQINSSSSRNTDSYPRDRCALHLKQMIIGEFKDEFNALEIFIKQTPNLKSLTISATNNIDIIDACRWEHLITSSVPYLDSFKFKFGCCRFEYNHKTMFNNLKRFQTDFWQKQHHWYTEYVKERISTLIYTIPYISNTYEITSKNIRYTDHLINNVNTFVNVTDLTLADEILTENCQHYFSNVTSLTINHPNFRSLLTIERIEHLKKIINLFNLKHLCIVQIGNVEISSAFLEILKEAPQLSALSIDSTSLESLFQNDELCKYLNKMIKRLHQQYIWGTDFYNSNQENQFCEIFSNIEHLQFAINNEDNLLFLLSHLPKLSTVKLTLKRPGDIELAFDRFENEAPKLNANFDINYTHGSTYDRERHHTDYYTETKIFIWIGENIGESTKKNNVN